MKKPPLPHSDLIDALHHRIVQVSITNSALRNQGPAGTINQVRNYLVDELPPILVFVALQNGTFSELLDEHTKCLKKTPGRRSPRLKWGTSRKALNLYIRGLVYNKFLSDHFVPNILPSHFDSFISPLEVPLDSHSASGLRDKCPKLKKWPGIIHLTATLSQEYQNAAQVIANTKGFARVHLDLEYWRKKE